MFLVILWALFKPRENVWVDKVEEKVEEEFFTPAAKPPHRVDPEHFRQTVVIPRETLDRISAKPLPRGKTRWRHSNRSPTNT